jgi:transcriptional regulator with XRE-family HTH domain
MSITDKIKQVLYSKDKQTKYLADFLGISVQAVRNKFSRGSFSASDLIIISEALGYELAFIPPNFNPYEDEKFILSIEDLSENEQKQIWLAKNIKEQERIKNWTNQLKNMTPSELEQVQRNLNAIHKFIDERYENTTEDTNKFGTNKPKS